MSNDKIRSDPAPLPAQPAILVLIHPRRRKAFVSYSKNVRGRGAVLTTAIRNRKKQDRNHLRDMPEGGLEDFALLATHIGLSKRHADERVAQVQRQFERKGFTIFGGTRSAQPKVLLDGKRYTIVDAMEVTKCKEAYQTVYRRIQRGWTPKEALGVVDRV